jgi:hypothetical protein
VPVNKCLLLTDSVAKVGFWIGAARWRVIFEFAASPFLPCAPVGASAMMIEHWLLRLKPDFLVTRRIAWALLAVVAP